ncbi:Uncharacterized conserved protein, DUF885 familyt [Agromyces cerinus subsp. cerinus]|uniref:Uncharacterized conserved protein, DUF885 familyt n=2 Tax=Agromyces cerinus TaxID=33878 RepID=A0A1N6F0L5_9MICO|nr:Uncharacterized conserved protein, DUF885 familyt [Agromyces cerinus subsp. cerinus]
MSAHETNVAGMAQIDADLARLGTEFRQWRAANSFRTSDDIPRVERPAGWVPRIDPVSVEERRRELAGFVEQWRATDVSGLPIPDQVDHRLLGSALARVRWELDVLRNWERDAVFLTSQILGPWFDLLLAPPPFGAARQADLVTVLGAVPQAVEQAIANLERAGVATLARVAAAELASIGSRLAGSVSALTAHVDAATATALAAAQPAASAALTRYAQWLEASAGRLGPEVVVGRDAFVWYLRHVALVATEPEELVRAALQEYRRAVAAETISRNRHRAVTDAPLAADVAAEVAAQAAAEAEVRALYEREGLLSQPESLRRYRFAEYPAYLEPIAFLGVTDDLTNERSREGDAVSYVPVPAVELPYFDAANARDPRLGIIHEGAHSQQLALSWGHPRAMRRQYVDSVANEGIAHYNEELMLDAGLFDDAPHSQTIVHNFMRLRALRVVVDVNLATGVFGLDEAIDFFVRLVPMDAPTATEETSYYVATPGLAMAYLVGKLEVKRLLADAVVARGDDFSLREFHDSLWLNGNVPVSLQRWELLGDRGDVDVLDAAGDWAETFPG